MNILTDINWNEVKDHYDRRIHTHAKILDSIRARDVNGTAKLSLGISDPSGNYSADEHKLGPLILANNQNAAKRVFEFLLLAIKSDGNKIVELVRNANISYFKIGVGSESSCMVNPNNCWITNSRSLWAFLLDKHRGNYEIADEELSLYRQGDQNSEMSYNMWKDLHIMMKSFLTRIHNNSKIDATKIGIDPDKAKYIWTDAIANWIYSEHHG